MGFVIECRQRMVELSYLVGELKKGSRSLYLRKNTGNEVPQMFEIIKEERFR